MALELQSIGNREQLAHNCMFSIAACSVNKNISGACYCGWVVPNEHTGN